MTTPTTPAEVLRLAREALAFYADESRYHGPNQPLDSPDKWSDAAGLKAYRLDVTRDRGAIASKALAAIDALQSTHPADASICAPASLHAAALAMVAAMDQMAAGTDGAWWEDWCNGNGDPCDLIGPAIAGLRAAVGGFSAPAGLAERVQAALSMPACDRLREWAAIGPAQLAAVESLAELVLLWERGAKAWAGVDPQALRDGQPSAPSGEPAAPFLFIAMDDDKRAHLTWCADESEVEAAVSLAMFWLRPGEELNAEYAEQLTANVEELLDSGTLTFEGDPPLYLYRVGGTAPTRQAPQAAHTAAPADLLRVAIGTLAHDRMGGCPDEVEGWAARDPQCAACRAIMAAEAVHTAAAPQAQVRALTDAQKDQVLADVVGLLSRQHEWLTRVAAINLVAGLYGRAGAVLAAPSQQGE